MSDADVILDFLKAMAILMFFFMVLYLIWGVVAPEPQLNVSEKIVDKEIVHLHKFMDTDPDYYIYTENYCFNLNLHDYNSLNVGDSVNLTVMNGTNFATLVLDTGEYYNV